jgi:hypothetical protein
MRHMKWHSALLLFASLALVFVMGCTRAGASGTGSASDLKPLTIDQVSAKIAANDGKTFIYDNNNHDSWAAAHVPGAKWLDDENVTANDLPADKTATLIFYCHNEL